MRAIILAAGMGTRLGSHTADKPKCLVHLAGKPLLEYQLDVLKLVTDDIVVVRGYKAEKIDYPGIRYVDNLEFESTNMVASLMAARDEFAGDCIVCYSDIVYEPRVIRELEQANCSVGVVVDADFREYWTNRPGGETDHEMLRIEDQNKIVEIGEPMLESNMIDARYVGLLKFDHKGTRNFKAVFDKHNHLYGECSKPWYNSRSFRQAYMTDMVQALIDDSVDVSAIKIERGWLEIDTEEDLEIYHQWLRTGAMHRFFIPPATRI